MNIESMSAGEAIATGVLLFLGAGSAILIWMVAVLVSVMRAAIEIPQWLWAIATVIAVGVPTGLVVGSVIVVLS